MDEHRRTAALSWIGQPRPIPIVGGTAIVRGARPDDADALATMHLRCSSDSVLERYFTVAPRLSPAWQRSLLSTDVALVATSPRVERGSGGAAGRSPVVAIGNLQGTPRGGAEVGLLVEDGFQRRGLGTAMLAELAAAAWLLGHRSLRADTLPTSTAVHRLIARLGPHTVSPARAGGLTTFVVRLDHRSLAGLGDPLVPVRLVAPADRGAPGQAFVPVRHTL